MASFRAKKTMTLEMLDTVVQRLVAVGHTDAAARSDCGSALPRRRRKKKKEEAIGGGMDWDGL